MQASLSAHGFAESWIMPADIQLKPVKSSTNKCVLQDSANLGVFFSFPQLLRRSSDRQIIDDDLSLFESSLGHAFQLKEFVVPEMLNAEPDSGPEHDQNDPQGLSTLQQ